MDITEYVNRRGITVEITRDCGAQIQDGWEHHAYVLSLHNADNGQRLETPWRQGVAIDTSPTDTPDAVFNALITEAWAAHKAASFEDWANALGCDTDSRKAESEYRECVDAAACLMVFLGSAAEFEYVATEVDPL